MSVAVRIPLSRSHHSDHTNLRPHIAFDGPRFVLHFGARGKVRFEASTHDVRSLAAALIQLADATDVAAGRRRVQQ